MTEKFTVEQTLAWLERAVEERGQDFNYREHFNRPQYISATDVRDHRPQSDCRYVEFDDHDEATLPGCIAGMVFHYAGMPMEVLRASEGRIASFIARDNGFDIGAGEVLQKAQRRQDDGAAWGHALAAAKQRAAELTYGAA